jgi:hypothetical protein
MLRGRHGRPGGTEPELRARGANGRASAGQALRGPMGAGPPGTGTGRTTSKPIRPPGCAASSARNHQARCVGPTARSPVRSMPTPRGPTRRRKRDGRMPLQSWRFRPNISADYRPRSVARSPSSMRNSSLSEETLAWPNGPRRSPPAPCRRHLGRRNFVTA